MTLRDPPFIHQCSIVVFKTILQLNSSLKPVTNEEKRVSWPGIQRRHNNNSMHLVTFLSIELSYPTHYSSIFDVQCARYAQTMLILDMLMRHLKFLFSTIWNSIKISKLKSIRIIFGRIIFKIPVLLNLSIYNSLLTVLHNITKNKIHVLQIRF